MNHKRYFYNPYIILKIFHDVTFRAQTWPQYDLSFRSKPEVEYFKKSYLMNHKDIFSQSLHHLKDLSLYYISYTDMTLIWPLLLVENGRSRKQKYSEVLFRMYCVHPVPAQRAFPPHTIIVCAHIQHEAVVFNQVARRTELHVYM